MRTPLETQKEVLAVLKGERQRIKELFETDPTHYSTLKEQCDKAIRTVESCIRDLQQDGAQ